ncbi:sodium:solute symporter family transporter, partial [Mesonia mobilis]|uniref:sodium:solute symporter family transporter n=1 Tax=Mesonia mobilis TaxID=369791 RepID=UPI0026ED9ECB
MHILDSIVLVATLAFIVIFGYYQTRGSKNVSDFLKGGNEARWWTVGLSVMATQASAITFLSAPGQAFHSGMGFVQFYLGVPIAMIVICMVFIPIYHRLKVYTAYEYLESRFDLKTRTLTALLFLIQRGLAAGITIFAPSIILSAVLGWNLITLNIIIGSLVVIYTVSGGTKAVSVTQKQQMGVIFLGLIIAFVLIVNDLPQDITFSNALEIAAANEKLNVLDFSFEWDNRYTFWSGLIGGTFLALSYFGTDQSQVQRYLSASSLKESQMGLIFNGFLKVPMQFFILLIGVMMFVFYQFNASPLNFNPAGEKEVLNSEYADEYRKLQQELEKNRQEKAQLNYALINTEEKAPIQQEIQNLKQIEARFKQTLNTIALLDQQIKISEDLLEEKLTTEYNHLNLLKEKSNLETKQMEDEEAKIGGKSAITVARTSLADAEIRFENVTRSFLEESEKELEDASREIAQLNEIKKKLLDSLSRTVITAPVDGIIKDLVYYTEGGVIPPNSSVMNIVPTGKELVIEAKLPTA